MESQSPQLKYLRKLRSQGWQQLAAMVPAEEHKEASDLCYKHGETIRGLIRRGVQHLRDELTRKGLI